MLTVHTILLVIAFILFLLAAFGIAARINLVAAGLAVWVLAALLAGAGAVVR